MENSKISTLAAKDQKIRKTASAEFYLDRNYEEAKSQHEEKNVINILTPKENIKKT